MVPVANASAVGLRCVINDQEINEIFDILKERTIAFDNQTWNRRYRGFMDKIKTGSVFDVAEVMLYQLDKLDGDIDFAALRAAKLVPSTAKRAKIVLKGEVSKKLVLKGVLATAGARAAIEAAGGKVEE